MSAPRQPRSTGVMPAALAPQNEVAKRVGQGWGARYKFKGKPVPHIVESDTPLPTIPFQGRRAHDLTGKRIRGLTVVGQWDDGIHWSKRRTRGGHQKHKARWVCRCACGRYLVRKGAVLRDDRPRDSCRECYHVDHIAGRDR